MDQFIAEQIRYPPKQDGCHFVDGVSKRIFLNKIIFFIQVSLKHQYASIGSDDGLVPNRRHAII